MANYSINDRGGWIIPPRTMLGVGVAVPAYSELGDGCVLGDGCELGHCCKLGYGCRLGNGCRLGDGCELGHCCKLEEACELGVRCALGAGCDLGRGCKLGVGCRLGTACVLGYGCVLGYCCSLGDGCKLIGLAEQPGLGSSVADQIESHPETHNQSVWHSQCHTKHCVAGWTTIEAGYIGGLLEGQMGTQPAARVLLTAAGVTGVDFGPDADLESNLRALRRHP